MKILLSFPIAKIFFAGFMPVPAWKAGDARSNEDNDPLLPFAGVWK
jgi:hypothetical protein